MLSILQANWFNAQRFCSILGAELFVANDYVDKILVAEYLKNQDLIAARYWDSMWAGINCLGNDRNFVRAKDGTSVYLDWMRAEPNNRGGDEDCVSFVNYEGEWGSGYLDIKCSLELKYICQTYGTWQVKHKKNKRVFV